MYLREVFDIFKKVGHLHAFVESAEKLAGLSNIILWVYLLLTQV